MNMIDVAIVLFILVIGVCGIKNGFFKQSVLLVGTIIVFYLSFYTKDYIANFLSYNLPFFNFGGSIEGLKALNIILYQLVGFFIMFALFSAILAIIIKITGLFEKLLKLTVILAIPSKILGFILALIEGYIVVFIILFIVYQPSFNFEVLNESKLAPVILKSSPVLSSSIKDITDTCDGIYVLIDDYATNKDVNAFNKKAVTLMLDNKVITGEYLEKIVYKGKIYFPGVDGLISSYK